MRIDPIGNPSSSSQGRLDPKSTPRSVGAAGPTTPVTSQTSVQLESVRELTRAVSESTDVRASVVEDVKQRLQSGELLSEQSATDTARSILNL
jgi:anti-sigma28 factor (negative regulator of flagellin synthesis)